MIELLTLPCALGAPAETPSTAKGRKSCVVNQRLRVLIHFAPSERAGVAIGDVSD
ncbi:MAG: hypothetical protein R3A50_09770 [Saprospiraceae bacterium]|nr:hypothetical protein [Saprospiraceae bacterium]MCB9344701.1 hypothetical protein [Lewinellaceae bacterium]